MYVVYRGRTKGKRLSVHETRESAFRAAMAERRHYFGGWQLKETEKDYWINGRDFVKIKQESEEYD